MYHRQPNPDLPAIPEEGCGSPSSDSDRASSPADSPADDRASSAHGLDRGGGAADAATPADESLEEIDIHGVDDDTSCSAGAESLAYSVSSYAFTLDGVGFDEENSLVGSVVGSVAGVPHGAGRGGGLGGSALHTPPSKYTPERISRHERELHRETCRSLGLPYIEPPEVSDESSQEGTSKDMDSSYLGSISVSSMSTAAAGPGGASGSGEESEAGRKRKMDKMWPWPTKSGKRTEYNNLKANVNAIEGDPKQKRSSWKAYADQMREAMGSFSERIEDAYQKAKAQQDGQHSNQQYIPPTDVKESRPPVSSSSTHESEENSDRSVVLYRQGRTARGRFQLNKLIESYQRATPLARLTFAATILFMILCFVVILATVSGTKRSAPADGPPSSLGLGDGLHEGGGQDAESQHHVMDRFENQLHPGGKAEVDATNGADAPAGGFPSGPEDFFVAVEDANPPTEEPSYEPTTVPTGGPVAFAPPSSTLGDRWEDFPKASPCVDSTGKHKNRNGKSRECLWLTKNGDPSELKSARLDAECGLLEQSSELGLNCRHSCRAYNGCLLVPSGGNDESKREKKKNAAKEEDYSKLERVQHAPETEFPTESALLAFAPTIRPTAKPTATPTKKPTAVESIEETTETRPNNDVPTFIDARGRERQCWWLDIRNTNQKKIRRDANCVRAAVRELCPSSCADYAELTAMKMNSGQVNAGLTGTLAEEEDGRSEEDDESTNAAATSLSPPQLLQTIDTNGPSITEHEQSPPLQQHEKVQLHLHHDLLPQDECRDGTGYYLNNQGVPKKCSWLLGSDEDDPTDESRRMQNCGYQGGERTELSDLGRMCKNTCGTCL